MDTINTVNFEDLFDFSPEPAPGHHVIGGGGPTAATPAAVEDEAPREKLKTTVTSTSSRQDSEYTMPHSAIQFYPLTWEGDNVYCRLIYRISRRG